MRNLLNYQSSEYDCGPVSLLNGIRYLFDREEIYPDIVKFIMLYSLDTYNEQGELCKRGTSPAAVHYISNWLNHFSETRGFPIHCEYLAGEAVTIEPDGSICQALEKGGAVMVRVFLECPHYILLTGISEDRILLFDPYYEEAEDIASDEGYHTDEIHILWHSPKSANRSVSISRLNSTGVDYYQMGPVDCRAAIIMQRIS